MKKRGMMDIPDYQRLACELAEAARRLQAEAAKGGDAARAAKASAIAGRAIAMCNDLGVDPPCPPDHPWCALGCGKRDAAGRRVRITAEQRTSAGTAESTTLD